MKLHSRLLWLFVLLLHLVGAAGWWWLMPGGFGPGHPRFWVNQAVPVAVVLVVVAALVAARREDRRHIATAALLALAAMWAAAGVAAVAVFPISIGWRVVLLLAWAGVIALAARGVGIDRHRRGSFAAAGVCGALVGFCLPWTQRAPLPTTRPIGGTVASLTSARDEPAARSIRLGDLALVQPHQGLVTLQRGRYALWVEPLLTFISRSPDRCWTSLAPRRYRVGSRLLRDLDLSQGDVRALYEDDGVSTLAATATPDGVELTTHARLDRPVYSHLNSLLQVAVAGHRQLAVSFSPCPDERIDVLPMGYPVGRPARLAYVDGRGIFHVVEASSGEKGPFRPLAAGGLGSDQPLRITLHDGDHAFATITLHDWAAQASTARSPTAGYGLPQNAIEFSRSDDADGAPASLFVTLAGTSVGRGWDSVGHAAGVYRSRVTITMTVEGEE